MPKKRIVTVLILAALFALGIAVFANILIQSRQLTILSHDFRLEPISFSFAFVISFLLILAAWIAGSGILTRQGGLNPESALRSGFVALLPLGFFLLTPLLLKRYTTRQDLKTRLILLAVFILLAVVYLVFAEFRHLRERIRRRLETWEVRFAGLPLRKRLLILFLAAFLIYQAVTFILVRKDVTFSGDEPNYLMTTHSLLRDGDINLANNFADKDYFSFYSQKDNPRLKLGVYGRYGRQGKDHIYPINLPGISVLMLPFYWLSQFFSGKTLTFLLKGSLSLWAVLLGLQLYLLIRDLWNREKLSLLLWFLYSATAPVIFFATHLYPEIVIALFSLTVFRHVMFPDRLTPFQYLSLGFLLGTFPWFGLKYGFILGGLAAVSLYYIRKERRPLKHMALFFAGPILSALLFFGFIHHLYGTFSLFSVYEGVMTAEQQAAYKQMVLGIPLTERIDAFLDYFLDQRDGLLLYSPFYLFAFFGLVEMFRRQKRMFWSLAAVCLPFLLNYAFFTHRQGYSPQARVLMALSWAGVLAIGWFLVHNRKKIFSFFFGFAGLLSLVIAALLLFHPNFLYQPTTHEYTSRPGDLFAYVSNLHFFLPPYLPSFIKVNNLEYWPNYIWIAAILTLVLIYALRRKERPLGAVFRRGFAFVLLAAGIFLWTLFPRTVCYPVKTVNYSPQRALGFYLLPLGKGVVAKESGDFYLHFAKSYKFFFGSKTPLDKVKLVYGSDKGEFELKVLLFDLPLFDDKTSRHTKELIFSPAAAYRMRGRSYYEINLDLKQVSEESLLIDPYLFQVIPLKD